MNPLSAFVAAGDDGQLCSICDMRLDDCTCDWHKDAARAKARDVVVSGE